ncbi:bifunctional diaminohydroxyphosphoribosylaminopyrimidine deaminase/5-amino-6-(5-phosphoribosylamino)uracil reductase RibD [uncultured Treponema sp.]|uniref:bifunctional diaminohydroxyphosphoribosylaminopyrimidine deaminase/5-amino-6-(5-phosphoribosylamino)uracil reductase RibD n=1 Tax=uncultured Treponema sp. TaxID=162155 RepID=UPI0025CD741E|nr:bifunctional diaminohydroxyphosphoribosylaminopyrimidine deaminase/5-amino-6-(5-phosphoribosylamino)uracil reductase RibD [uncultured Treponema sp.]
MEALSEKFMLRAIELARFGTGRTNPNPLVGAVIVKNGEIIGEGWHHAWGELHAEREALKNCYQNGKNPEGATIYVTLEPCCHFGKQPPCTHALVEAKIARVVVGSRDPNPLVHGKGNSYLREHGILVEEDFLRSECDALNPIFLYYIQKKLPYVALKFAMTLDGKIACKTGESKWISNEKSREYVHALRNCYSGILAGINTVLKDDPMLNCRLCNDSGELTGRNPVRIILDSNLKIPLESKIVKSAREIKTIAACCDSCPDFQSKRAALEKAGVEILCTKSFMDEKTHKAQVDVLELMKILGEKQIDSVLVEGGGEVHYSMLNSGLVNKIYAFVAPKIFGGNAKSPVGGEGVNLVDEAFKFHLEKSTRFDDDILLEYVI